MTCPLAGHDLVAIGTVVHPDLLKYALGVNKYPPKRRDTELDLFLKKKKSLFREKHLGRGASYHDLYTWSCPYRDSPFSCYMNDYFKMYHDRQSSVVRFN